jgi:hypothetical protein
MVDSHTFFEEQTQLIMAITPMEQTMSDKPNPIYPPGREGSEMTHPSLLWPLALTLAVVTVAALAVVRLAGLESVPAVRRVCRDLGYLALFAMAVPYAYGFCSLYLLRRFGGLATVLRWHTGMSYVAVALTLIHARGHFFGGAVTTGLVLALVVVILSGVVGHGLQRPLYRLMALLVREERGESALAEDRESMARNAGDLVENYSMLVPSDILDWPWLCDTLREEGSLLNQKIYKHRSFGRLAQDLVQEVQTNPLYERRQRQTLEAINGVMRQADLFQPSILGASVPPELTALLARRPLDNSSRARERRNRLYFETLYPGVFRVSKPPRNSVIRFFKEEVLSYLESPAPSWQWLFGRAALRPVPENHYMRVKVLAPADQAVVIDELWAFVEERRQMDLEFWFHRLARLWLWVHGPVSAALLALVLAHCTLSVYYTGWF